MKHLLVLNFFRDGISVHILILNLHGRRGRLSEEVRVHKLLLILLVEQMLLLFCLSTAIYTEAVWEGYRLLMRRVQLFITDKCCCGGRLVLSLWHRKQSVRTHQREGIGCAVAVGLQTWRLVYAWPLALEGVLPCAPKVRTLERVIVNRRGSKLCDTHEAAAVKFQIRIPWWDLMIVLAGDISSHKEWRATYPMRGIILIVLVGTTTHVKGTLPNQDHGLHVILMSRLSPWFHVLSC